MTSRKRIENYRKTWSFIPSHGLTPRSAEELSDIVKSATKLRVMGARHSWSRGIITDDALVSLDAMSRVLQVDRQRLRVTAQAGIRLKDLVAKLEQHGLTLANLGSNSFLPTPFDRLAFIS